MRIGTWNSQGNRNQIYKDLLFGSKSIDILCVQEAGNCNPLWQPNRQYVDHEKHDFTQEIISFRDNYSKRYVKTVYWYNGLRTNCRCSLIIIIKLPNNQDVDVQPYLYHAIYEEEEMKTLRPLIGVQYGGAYIATTHCPAKNNGFSRTIRNNFAQELENKRKLNYMVGDFNYDARNQDQNLPVTMNIVAPKEATQQSGGILDYLVKKKESDVLDKIKMMLGGNYESDHCLVYFDI